jgi:large subunit ribosomal protein L16
MKLHNKKIKTKKNKVKSIPKRQKFNKLHKGSVTPVSYTKSTTSLQIGRFGLKLLKNGRISSKQLNAAKQIITKVIRKKEKLWIRSFTDIPVTAKPKEVRMGKGKGSIEYWALRIKSGCLLLEISGITKKKAFALLNAASKKLPLPTLFIQQSNYLTKDWNINETFSPTKTTKNI